MVGVSRGKADAVRSEEKEVGRVREDHAKVNNHLTRQPKQC